MPLLLSHNPELILAYKDECFLIEQIPGWLAQYLGGAESDFLGKEAFSILEPSIPELRESVYQIAGSGGPVHGFELTLKEKDQTPHSLVMDGRRLPPVPGEAPRIAVTLQELPRQAWTSADLEKTAFQGLIGVSPAMHRVFNRIRLYANSDAPVLVTGETGAGKEGVAQALHRVNRRRKGPFVTVNCSAITETLFESEVFGHERGSFTGAIRSHRGKFERAHRGTLFLDEIGDLPLPSQAKLLRVLEEQVIERVGGEKPIAVDVRVVAATNRNLETDSMRQTFRPDLFYRINALQIRIPPLRERPEDLEPLVRFFIQDLNRKYQRNIVCLTHDAMDLLKQYRWPGNIRELRNLMERLFAETQTEVIGLRSLRDWYEERMQVTQNLAYDPNVTVLPYRKAIPLGMTGDENGVGSQSDQFASATTVLPIDTTIGPANQAAGNPAPELTRDALRGAFRKAGGNITKAAAILGIHKATFYRHLKDLGLSREDLE